MKAKTVAKKFNINSVCAKWLQYFLERNYSLCFIKDKHICNAQRHKETTIRESENTTFELHFVRPRSQ